MIFTCSCGASHDRGPIDGVATYRCLRCGNVTRVTHGQARVLEGHREALHKALDAILTDIEDRVMACGDAGDPGSQVGEGEIRLEALYRQEGSSLSRFADAKIIHVSPQAVTVTKGPDPKPTSWERVLKQPE